MNPESIQKVEPEQIEDEVKPTSFLFILAIDENNNWNIIGSSKAINLKELEEIASTSLTEPVTFHYLKHDFNPN
jgi:hypothetical protein